MCELFGKFLIMFFFFGKPAKSLVIIVYVSKQKKLTNFLKTLLKIDKAFFIMYYEINKLRRFKTMVDNGKEVRRQILDVIGMLAAAVTILVYVVLCQSSF